MNAFCVLIPIESACAFNPNVVDIDERPRARVEKDEIIIVLTVEKNPR